MMQEFLLHLTEQGITLDQGSDTTGAAAGWWRIGTVDIESPNLASELANLITQVDGDVATPLPVIALLPESQVKALTVDGTQLDTAAVDAALLGQTPYDPSDLRKDWREVGAETHIVAVANDTLEEATAFCNAHNFKVSAFATLPGESWGIEFARFGTPSDTNDKSHVNAPYILMDRPKPQPAAATAPQKAVETQGHPPVAPKPAAKPETVPAKAKTTTAPAPKPDTKVSNDPPKKAVATKSVPQSAAGTPKTTDMSKGTPPPETIAKKAKTTVVADGSSNKASLKSTPATGGAANGSDPQILFDKPVDTSAAQTAKPTATAAPQPDPKNGTGAIAGTPPTEQSLQKKTDVVSKTVATAAIQSTGAKQSPRKPKYLLLILTALLLLFLFAVAAWAATSGREVIASWFGDGSPEASETTVASTDTATPTTGLQSPDLDITPDVSGIIETPVVTAEVTDSVASLGTPQIGSTQSTAPVEVAAASQGLTIINDAVETVGLNLPVAQTDRPSSLNFPSRLEAPDVPTFDAAIQPMDLGDTASQIVDRLAGVFSPQNKTTTPQQEHDLTVLRASLSDDELAELDEAINNQDLLLSPEDRRYHATGVWVVDPLIPWADLSAPEVEIIPASIDPTTTGSDAVALPRVQSLRPDQRPATPQPYNPLASVTTQDATQDPQTTQGTIVTAQGVQVTFGKPAVLPPLRGEEPDDVQTLQPDAEALAQYRPTARPDDLIEANERILLGGMTRAELKTLRPELRPKSAQQKAQETRANDDGPSTLAVASSYRPFPRPAAIVRAAEKRIAAAKKAAEEEANAPPAKVARSAETVRPTGASRSSVTRAATTKNVLRLRRINLIGTYGRANARTALIRMPNGRFFKVKVGSRLDGGRVTAINNTQLKYTKNGRTITLKMPRL